MATFQQIAAWAGSATDHVVATPIDRITSIQDADAQSVVFATTPELLDAALASKAAVILVDQKSAAAAVDPRMLLVPNARLAFAEVAARLLVPPPTQVHATAQVASSATVPEGTHIGPGTVVGEGVSLGSGCILGAGVMIEQGTTLGERVRVQSGAVLGSLGFGYVRRQDGSYLPFPQMGTLVVEDDVDIGANSTIDRGALGETRIGAGTKIDNLVHIGHNCRIGRNVIIAAQTGISGSSVVEDGAILGGQVGIGEHATVGPHVILGGGAGVLSGKKMRGPGQVFWGRPAQPLKQYLRDLARLRRGS